MPHAEGSTNSGSVMTNGQDPPSKFIDHLTSYPVVNDSIETFKANQYGAKSIEIADGAYSRFGQPFIPYLRTPYSFAHPYVKKADSLADTGLQKVEARFPIVKEDTHTVVDSTRSFAFSFYPVRLADQGKDYVFGVWHDEYEKNAKISSRPNGVFSIGAVAINTELRIVSDALGYVANWFSPKKEEAKTKSSGLINQATSATESYADKAKKNAETYKSKAQEKAN